MNDSFLEDLELLPTESKQGISSQLNKYGNKNVTTRDGMPLPLTHAVNLLENESKQRRKSKTSPSSFKQTETKQVQKDTKRYSEPERDTKKQDSKEIQKNKLDKREKLTRIEVKKKENIDKTKTKVSESGTKVIESRTLITKEHSQRSGSFKENNHTLDPSSKENSRPSEPSIESICNIPVKEKKRLSEGSIRNCETKDKDPVALLNAIKDLISTYTKQESTRILRAMQELHVNSQANLIKNLLCQTDELINEMHPSKNSVRLKSLLEENRRLREDMATLELRNSDLQKKLEELELLKHENSYLKLKYKELSNS